MDMGLFGHQVRFLKGLGFRGLGMHSPGVKRGLGKTFLLRLCMIHCFAMIKPY